jgi:hypothetical protein
VSAWLGPSQAREVPAKLPNVVLQRVVGDKRNSYLAVAAPALLKLEILYKDCGAAVMIDADIAGAGFAFIKLSVVVPNASACSAEIDVEIIEW